MWFQKTKVSLPMEEVPVNTTLLSSQLRTSVFLPLQHDLILRASGLSLGSGSALMKWNTLVILGTLSSTSVLSPKEKSTGSRKLFLQFQWKPHGFLELRHCYQRILVTACLFKLLGWRVLEESPWLYLSISPPLHFYKLFFKVEANWHWSLCKNV